MDGRHMDQIAKVLADGVSRRATLKALTGALGLSAAGVLATPGSSLAQDGYCICNYLCNGRFRSRCVRDSTDPCPFFKGPCQRTTDPICSYPTRQQCRDNIGDV
jgi:hypothetical protein